MVVPGHGYPWIAPWEVSLPLCPEQCHPANFRAALVSNSVKLVNDLALYGVPSGERSGTGS